MVYSHYALTCDVTEKILREDPRVQSSVMFGRGRFNAGVLIDPKPEYKFDPADEEKLAAFRNAIWFVVCVTRSSN